MSLRGGRVSVKVSVLAYEPVRSASLALTGCLKPIFTASLETGFAHAGARSERRAADRRVDVARVAPRTALACSFWAGRTRR